MLEKAAILEQLTRVEGHVCLAVRHIREQENRITQGDRRGWDTAVSRNLLETFRDTLRLHIEDRDRLRQQLAALTA